MIRDEAPLPLEKRGMARSSSQPKLNYVEPDSEMLDKEREWEEYEEKLFSGFIDLSENDRKIKGFVPKHVKMVKQIYRPVSFDDSSDRLQFWNQHLAYPPPREVDMFKEIFYKFQIEESSDKRLYSNKGRITNLFHDECAM